MKIRSEQAAYYGIVVLATLARLLPHPPNFTPVGALGLYTGAYADRIAAWIVPVIALFISDLILGLYDPVSMLFVYIGFMLSMYIGKRLLSQKRHVLNIVTACFASALLFFLVSNLGVWFSGTLYPMTLSGLLTCFLAAIPFFGYTLAGNLVYGAAMFGLFEYLIKISSNSRLPNTA